MGMKNIDRARIKAILFAEFEGICIYCMKQVEFDKFTLDHVIPVAYGGRNKIDNIIPACYNCNQKRRHKSLISVMKYRDSLADNRRRRELNLKQLRSVKDKNFEKDTEWMLQPRLKTIGNAIQDFLFGKKVNSHERHDAKI
jgi:hypothetical protein